MVREAKGTDKGKTIPTERMEPYENALAESPTQKAIVARLRREQALGGDQTPAIHEMSPPGLETQDLSEKLGDAAGASEDGPPEGCSVAQLRDYIMGMFQLNAKNLRDFEAQVTEKFHTLDQTDTDARMRLQALDPLVPHARDLGVFDQMKVLVKQEEFKSRNDEVQQAMQTLDAQLREMKETINGYVIKIEGVEGEFKDHVGKAFHILEAECKDLRNTVNKVGEVTGENRAVTEGQVAMQLAIHKNQLEQTTEQAAQQEREMGNIKGKIDLLHSHFTEQLDMAGQGLSTRVMSIEATIRELATAPHVRRASAPGSTDAGRDPWHHYGPSAGSSNQYGSGTGSDGNYGKGTGSGGPPDGGGRGHGGSGPGGNGPGDGRGMAGDGHSRDAPRKVNASMPDMDDVRMSKLFDDKVALSTAYSYDGGAHGDHWRRKVRGYWVSKCPALLPILNWAESMDGDEITLELLQAEAKSCRWMTEVNIERAGEIIWGFLNICLHDRAHTCLEGADMLNGFEGWRLVVQHIHQGRKVHKATLRKLVKNPPNINKLEDVAMGITHFENIMKDYKAAGGQLPDEIELKEDLVNTLPQEIRENLLWRASREDETFNAFKNHVKTTANSVLYHRGKTRPINGLDHREAEIPENEEYNNEFDEAIGAVYKRFGKGKGQGKGGKGGGGTFNLPIYPKQKGGGGKGADWNPKCANCGGDHERRQCTKAEVPMSERPCHGCGEKGHISRNCPKRQQRFVKAVDEAPAATAPPGPVIFGCVDFADCSKSNADKARMGLPPGFSVPRKAAKPRPRGATLGEFVLTNSFHALQCPCGEHGRRGTTRTPRKAEVRTAGEISKMVTKKRGNEPNTEKHDEEILAPVEFAPLLRGSMGDQGSGRRRRHGKATPSSSPTATSRTATSMDALASLPSTSNLDNTGGQGRPGSHGAAKTNDPGRGSTGTGSSTQDHSRSPSTSSSQTLPVEKGFTDFPTANSTPKSPMDPTTGGQGRPGSHGAAHAGDVSGGRSVVGPCQNGTVRGARGVRALRAHPGVRALCAHPGEVGTHQGRVGRRVHGHPTEEMLIAPLEYADPEPGEIMTATRRVKMYVAADTGAVDHCVGPRDLPESVLVKKNPNQRGLIGAKGDGIDCYGFANVNLEQADGHMINSNVLVADVCRPLHSISKVCDNNHDMIFTKKGGVVVQAGVFDKLLATVKHVATYPRRGGLYVGEFDCIDPGECPDGAKPSGFAGQGASR